MANQISNADSVLDLAISERDDLYWICRQCAVFSEQLGFGIKEIWEVSIVVSELVTNLMKYAGGGNLSLSWVKSPFAGVEIVVEDNGPGIKNVEAAMTDGYSEGRSIKEDPNVISRRGLGLGLSAVCRLTDAVTIDNKPLGGTRIVAYKYLPEDDTNEVLPTP